MGMKQQIAMQTIKIARGIFANTPVQKWNLTTSIYRKVFNYGYDQEEVTIDFRGVNLTIPTKDVTIVPGLIGGFYEKIELDIYQELAKKSSVIIDVGGSIGDYTSVGAKYLPEKGKLIVFEPIPENVAYITRNLKQNNLNGKVKIEAMAVSDIDGKITMHTVEGSVGTHSASKKSAAGISSNSIVVPVTTLDSYISKQKIKTVDILKIDIEGYDGFALRGAKKLLSDSSPTVFIEFVSDNLTNCGFDPQEFLQILLAHYKIIFMIDEPRGLIKRCTEEDLESLVKKSINANLIVSNDPDHLRVIKNFLDKKAD